MALDVQTVQALREHRKRQAAERLQAGAGWQDNDLVFSTVEGRPLHPERQVSRPFASYQGKLKFLDAWLIL